MSLDRTEDVELIDAPKELALSKLWRRQYEGLTHLIFNIDRDRVKAVMKPKKHLGSLPDYDLGELHDEYNINVNSPVRINYVGQYGNSIWETNSLTDCPSDLHTYIKFSKLRKAVVSYNRNANPEWNHEKAEKRLSDYNKLKEEVAGNKEITMPEIQLPCKAPTMPFTAKASELLQTFMDDVYDFETRLYQRQTFTVLTLAKRKATTKRRILISIDEETEEEDKPEEPKSDWRIVEADRMLDITALFQELKQIEEFYDAPSVFASVMHHISHLEKFHEKDDEDEGWQSFP